ncbi:RIPOR family member 3 isoform X2 [Trichomycterus rosablanca]
MSSSARMVGSIWGKHPEQVDRIFQALRKGLKEYLENRQAELDFLTSQQRNTKRNSRLAFFYDLEKEIRTSERYIRRLQFQLSKIEELYEMYCIQWRLCQGALNMKHAFSLSPSSRASRESLLELNRNHRHSLEDMCATEAELELLLGELQIKMKGLIGFARLCPGDQYEVLIRLGSQRWKIRGRIQTDDRQIWDEVDMVFLPRIHENFEIKVTEIKSLSSMLVGMVTCKSAEFFMARPQTMVVDITELGTIKLQMEVIWNPFDSGLVKPVMSSASRQSMHSRTGSVNSWSPQNTASFTEKYFLSKMRHFQDMDSTFSIGSCESRGVSILSYLSDSAQTLSPLANDNPLSTVSDPSMDFQPVDDILRTPLGEEDESGEWPSGSETGFPSPRGNKDDSIFHYQHFSTPDILRRNCKVNAKQEVEAKGMTTIDETRVEKVQVKQPMILKAGVGNFQKRAAAIKATLAQAQVDAALEEMNCAKAELKDLELQMLRLNQVLKRDIFLPQKSSDETLNVEEEKVLGSFDFLSTFFNIEDNISCTGSVRLRDSMSCLYNEDVVKSPEVMTKNTALTLENQQPGHRANSTEMEKNGPLSTGDYTLDQALEIHLNICTALLRALRLSDLEHVQQEILKELSRQTKVLEKISSLTEKGTDYISVSELLTRVPKLRNVQMLWEEFCENGFAFCCVADSFLRALRKRFIHKVEAKLPGQADTVFTQLLQQIQSSCMMVPLGVGTTDQVTVFQLDVYLSRWKLSDFGKHISHLSKEVYLVSCLQSPKRMRTLKKLKGQKISKLQPMRKTLHLLAKLLTDSNHKVSASATSCLCRASGFKSFRSKALIYYAWLLKDNDTQVQQQACLALKCLKAIESAEQVAELWRSTDEALRNAAKETVLSFGKNGHAAFQRMEQICTQLQEEIYKNLDTEITIL